MVRAVGRGDSGEFSARKAKCRVASKEGLSSSAEGEGSHRRSGGETDLAVCPPTLALSLIHGQATPFFQPHFSQLCEEMKLACVHGSHPDCEMRDFHCFFPLWHWIQMTKADTVPQ